MSQIKIISKNVDFDSMTIQTAIDDLVVDTLPYLDEKSTITANERTKKAYSDSQNCLRKFGETLYIDSYNIKNINLKFKEYDDMVRNIMTLGEY